MTEEALKPRRRQLGVTHRMPDRLMPEIGLDGSGIDAAVRELEPTRMAKHVGIARRRPKSPNDLNPRHIPLTGQEAQPFASGHMSAPNLAT